MAKMGLLRRSHLLDVDWPALGALVKRRKVPVWLIGHPEVFKAESQGVLHLEVLRGESVATGSASEQETRLTYSSYKLLKLRTLR